MFSDDVILFLFECGKRALVKPKGMTNAHNGHSVYKMLCQEHHPHLHKFDGSPYKDQVLRNIELPKDGQSNCLHRAMDMDS